MARYYGSVGFATFVETSRGIWESSIVERTYHGEIMSFRQDISNRDNINGRIDINNRISILADPYANNNFQNARYITWHGSKWCIVSVEVEHPRLILQIGGLYNENETIASN